MKNLTKEIKEMKISEAMKIANNFNEYKGDENKILSSYVKIAALAEVLAGAAKDLGDNIAKVYKKAGATAEAEAEISLLQKDGENKLTKILAEVKEEITSKTEIDFKSYQEDNDISIEMANGQPNARLDDIRKKYPEVAGIIVGETNKIKVFKNPSLYGNNDAFNEAALIDVTLAKYQKAKITKKYKTSLTTSIIDETN